MSSIWGTFSRGPGAGAGRVNNRIWNMNICIVLKQREYDINDHKINQICIIRVLLDNILLFTAESIVLDHAHK